MRQLQRMSKRTYSAIAIISVLAAAALVVVLAARRGPATPASIEPPVISNPNSVDLLKEATSKIEEDRNEPVGRRAKVEIPLELRHYSDHRRFLAVQTAEWEEHKFEIPHDFAQLADQISRGELMEVKPLNDDYILYGVGWKATDEPLTHFDQAAGRSTPLIRNNAECEAERDRLTANVTRLTEHIKDMRKQLAKARGRGVRAGLSRQAREAKESAESAAKERDLLDSYCGNPRRLSILTTEYETLAKFAANLAGDSYDPTSAASLRAFKVRLLSFLRPEAKTVLEQIAHGYKKEFNRPLPITSLVRTEEYQRHLRETNRSAAANATPPHTMGLAFDVYYHFMSAAEQSFLMAEIGRMKDAGRIEALRETRDHIHVFVFADGKPPREDLIAASLARRGAGFKEKHASRNAVRLRRKPAS